MGTIVVKKVTRGNGVKKNVTQNDDTSPAGDNSHMYCEK